MPNPLQNLAISDTGFVFDPKTGNTFTLNETALFILRLLKEEKTKEEVLLALLSEYETDKEEVDRDFEDISLHLKSFGLIQ